MKTPNKTYILLVMQQSFFIKEDSMWSLIQSQNSIASELSGSWYIEKNIAENIY